MSIKLDNEAGLDATTAVRVVVVRAAAAGDIAEADVAGIRRAQPPASGGAVANLGPIFEAFVKLQLMVIFTG